MKWIVIALLGYFVYSQFLQPSLATSQPQATYVTPAKLAAAFQGKPVEMYATSWCGYCRQARNYMQQHNIPFVEYDIEKDSAAKQRMQRLKGDRVTDSNKVGVPFFVANGRTKQGYSEEKFVRFLARASQ